MGLFLFVCRHLSDINITLRERYLYLIIVQGIVNQFTGLCLIREFFVYQYQLLDCQVYAVITKVLEVYCHIAFLTDDITTVFILHVQWRYCLKDNLAHIFYIAAVCHTYRYNHQFVIMVLGEILEVFSEQVTIQKCHHATVAGEYLRTLIGDTLHAASHTVALYDVADMHTTRHQLDTIEEIVQYILHGKTYTCGKTRGNQRDTFFRYIEHHHRYQGEDTPDEYADDILEKIEVGQIDMQFERTVLTNQRFHPVVTVKSLYGIIEIKEQERQLRDIKYHFRIYLYDTWRIDNHSTEKSATYNRQVEDVRCQIRTVWDGINQQDRNDGQLYEIVQPCDLNIYTLQVKTAFHLMIDMKGTKPLGKMILVIHLQQMVASGNRGNDSKLEQPPHYNLHTKQDISAPRHYSRDDHGQQRNPGISRIGLRDMIAHLMYDIHLPCDKHNQQRWKYQVEHTVGYEYHPECDDDQPHHNNRRIGIQSVLDLFISQAQQQ